MSTRGDIKDIADAIRYLADRHFDAISKLGLNAAHTDMGAIEALSDRIGTGLSDCASALTNIANNK